MKKEKEIFYVIMNCTGRKKEYSMYKVEHENIVETGGIINLLNNNNEKLGTLGYHRDDNFIKIKSICVEKDFRRKGISEELIYVLYIIFKKELRSKYIYATSNPDNGGPSSSKWTNYLIRMGIRESYNLERKKEADKNRKKILKKMRCIKSENQIICLAKVRFLNHTKNRKEQNK